MVAIEELSFSVNRGEILGLVGPDGAGKTTMLRILAGVLPADAGSVQVAGADVIRDPEAVKTHISYMPQQFGLYEDLTVDENIRFYAELFQISAIERDRRSAQLLAACGMGPFRRRLAGNLSGGMKRKLALVCALINRPQVLLLDEPTTGVDPVSRRELWAILYAMVFEGVTAVVSTAYLDEAERCHRLLLLHRGRGLFCGTPPEAQTHAAGMGDFSRFGRAGKAGSGAGRGRRRAERARDGRFAAARGGRSRTADRRATPAARISGP